MVASRKLSREIHETFHLARYTVLLAQVRGIGTDVGIVSSMVFLAQFILSLTMGTIIEFAS